VILDVKPVIDATGGIMARVEVEISQIDESQRVLGVPGFLKRRSVTDIRLLDGETLVLAGLVSRLDSRDRSAVPGLGRVPFAGRAFRADQRRREGTELVIFLTPKVRRGADAGVQALTERVERRLEESR
jgi:pilus assembly protein CpaC